MSGPEGTTELPLHHCTDTLRAAPITAVDPVLGKLTIELPGGATETRYGRPWMFGQGADPKPGDCLVEYADGFRTVMPRRAFQASYEPTPDVAMVMIEGRFTPEQIAEWKAAWHALPLHAPGLFHMEDAQRV